MSPRTLTELHIRDAPPLGVDQEVGSAVRQVTGSGLPALPVVDAAGALKGLFGEREFIGAIFPGYLGELHSAAFVTRKLDEQLDRRAGCSGDPVSKYMNTERVAVGPDFADAQLAETFLHHRVLIIPVVENGQVRGAITRSEFFEALAERFVART